MPVTVGYTEAMTYGEFRKAVRKSSKVLVWTSLYLDKHGDHCDGLYVKVSKKDILNRTKDLKNEYFDARFGLYDDIKDVLFVN